MLTLHILTDDANEREIDQVLSPVVPRVGETIWITAFNQNDYPYLETWIVKRICYWMPGQSRGWDSQDVTTDVAVFVAK